MASAEMRKKKAKEIYDRFIYVELLVMNTEVRSLGLRLSVTWAHAKDHLPLS